MSIDLERDEVIKAVEGIRKLSAKKADVLLDNSTDIHLQFSLKKIPQEDIKTRIHTIRLPHGLHRKNTEICIFVKDIDTKSREYELTVDYFKDLFRHNDIDCISEIIPIKALKLEYQTFEAKRNLARNYDLYLADVRIHHLLPPLLGKAFYKRKRQPALVNLANPVYGVKTEINYVVNNTRCVMLGRGSCSTVRVGHLDLTNEQIADNIQATVNRLTEVLPGGAVNFRNICIKAAKISLSVPIYVSMGSIKEVVLPKRRKEKRELVVDEITTQEDVKVVVTPTGNVEVFKDTMGKKKILEKLKQKSVKVKRLQTGHIKRGEKKRKLEKKRKSEKTKKSEKTRKSEKTAKGKKTQKSKT